MLLNWRKEEKTHTKFQQDSEDSASLEEMWENQGPSVQRPILTDREKNILILAGRRREGRRTTDIEIGKELGISTVSVRALIHQACLKLGATDRLTAVYLSLQSGELRLSDLFSVEEMAVVLRTVDPSILRRIADCVEQNDVPTSPPGPSDSIPSASLRSAHNLTPRERSIIILACRGFSNKVISDKLQISTSSVRIFLYRAFAKLGASRKADAIRVVLEGGEIGLSEIFSAEEVKYHLAPFGAQPIREIAELVEKRWYER